ncbi:MAG TPA: ferric reductase-like transmembrane domain-containing protein [Roseiflexaceae bacterium]|nr:ferric reductase-like transmembrane domain-containing protein [Roseiflexaceae bacterium]
MALWHDKRGRFSPLRAVTLVLLVLPLLIVTYYAVAQQLGPRPVNEAIHEIGSWAIRLLFVALFITPMRRIARYAPLVDVRRMIGVTAFLYLLLHLVLYVVDQAYDLPKVTAEIVLRYYLTIGFTAFVGMATLAATSNDYMVRQLSGIRWRHLHWWVYPIAILGMIHHFLQSKLQVFEPTWMAGILLWLLMYRVMHWAWPRNGEFPLWVIALSWFVAGALTFLTEAIAFSIAYNVPVLRVLEIDFNFQAGIRPGWYVWGVGAIVILIGLIRLKPAGRLQLASSTPG